MIKLGVQEKLYSINYVKTLEKVKVNAFSLQSYLKKKIVDHSAEELTE